MAGFYRYDLFRSGEHHSHLRILDCKQLRSARLVCKSAIDPFLPADISRHVTLLTIAVALLATAFNMFAAKRLPMFEGMILYLHIFLWFGVSRKLA